MANGLQSDTRSTGLRIPGQLVQGPRDLSPAIEQLSNAFRKGQITAEAIRDRFSKRAIEEDRARTAQAVVAQKEATEVAPLRLEAQKATLDPTLVALQVQAEKGGLEGQIAEQEFKKRTRKTVEATQAALLGQAHDEVTGGIKAEAVREMAFQYPHLIKPEYDQQGRVQNKDEVLNQMAQVRNQQKFFQAAKDLADNVQSKDFTHEDGSLESKIVYKNTNIEIPFAQQQAIAAAHSMVPGGVISDPKLAAAFGAPGQFIKPPAAPAAPAGPRELTSIDQLGQPVTGQTATPAQLGAAAVTAGPPAQRAQQLLAGTSFSANPAISQGISSAFQGIAQTEVEAAQLTEAIASGKLSAFPRQAEESQVGQFTPSGGVIISSGKGGKKPTEVQAKANTFVRRMTLAEQGYEQIISAGYNPSNPAAALARGLAQVQGRHPVLGAASQAVLTRFGPEVTQNAFADARVANQLQDAFISGILRSDSGAAVPPAELAQYNTIFFPIAGDPPLAVENKRRLRQSAISSMQQAASGNLDDASYERNLEAITNIPFPVGLSTRPAADLGAGIGETPLEGTAAPLVGTAAPTGIDNVPLFKRGDPIPANVNRFAYEDAPSQTLVRRRTPPQ